MPKESALDVQLFECWRTARHVRQVQIVNSRRPGEIARAVAGEPVGTVIETERA